MDDQDAYMLKKELTYHQITDQVESHYLNLFNKEEWMLVKNAVLSKLDLIRPQTRQLPRPRSWCLCNSLDTQSNKTNLVYLWRHWALETRLSQAERKQEQEQWQLIPTGCRQRTNPEESEAD
jgi:hypothetical protein